MQISEKHMQEFTQLYREKYGVTLEYQDAYDRASRLLKLVEIVESNSDISSNLSQNPVV